MSAIHALTPRYDRWLTDAQAVKEILDFDAEYARIEEERADYVLHAIKDASISDDILTNVCESFDMTAQAMCGVFAAALTGQHEQASKLLAVLVKQAIADEADRHAAFVMNNGE